MKYPIYVEKAHLIPESDEILSKKVAALLAEMTEEEIMNLCHGHSNPPGTQVANAGYNPGVPRLGVPEIRMYDGPAGVTSIYETTGLPVQEMLAASWDTDLAYKYGKVEGSENFAISGNTQLGSQFDVVRVPQFSRDKDMLGEDPFLTASMAVPETKGIQEAGAVATLKHFGVACIGTDMQDAADQIVDEQTLHETYFRPFEAAAKEGKAGSFMCCYNKYNGAYSSANSYGQKEVMRDMWNFKGYMMSDWGANHALTTGKGMDMEMPNGTYNSNERLELGMKKGRITWEDVTAAASHVLYGMGLAGYLSYVELDENGKVKVEEGRTEPIRMKDRYTQSVKDGLLNDNADICLEVARKGAVLLKNENAALPLTAEDYTGDNSVALIGLGAEHLLSGAGQERSYGRISRMKSPASQLKVLAGENANIETAVAMDFFGTTIPADCLYQDEACTKPGVVRSYGVDEAEAEMPPFMAMMMADAKKDEKKEAPAGMPPFGGAPGGMPPFGEGMPGMPPFGEGGPAGMPPFGEGMPGMPPFGEGMPGMPPFGEPPAMDIGGGGKEFKGVASADEDEDADVAVHRPNWENNLAGTMPGHELGEFCAVDEVIEFTCGTSDGKINQNYKNAGDGTAFPKGSFYTWDGYLKVPADGDYTLILQAIGGNTIFKINLDGEKFTTVGSTELREGAQWPWGSLVCTPEGMEVHGSIVTLKAGKAYPIKVCVNASLKQKDLQLRLSWITPEQKKADYEKALSAASEAKKVVCFLAENYAFRPLGAPGGFFGMTGLASMDIPQDQLQLIRDVKAAMQPDAKLILMHNNGQIYALGEVEPICDAIMNIWTPGQEGGLAVAELLTGKVNPSGKTALTMPAKDSDTLVSDTEEHRKTRYESYVKDGKKVIDFDEGLFFGYRWYDKEQVQPLYAFGHGLSYTTFAYSDLSVSGTDVTFTVTNTGAVAGSEVAQLYLGACEVPAGVQMAQKALCGFARLENIQPGESRTVTVTVPERAFCYWNAAQELVARPDGTKDKWVRTAAPRKLWVGPASDKLVLEGEIN